MKIIRDGVSVSLGLEYLQAGDKIECDNYEELVAMTKKLADVNKNYQQKDPMVVTIV